MARPNKLQSLLQQLTNELVDGIFEALRGTTVDAIHGRAARPAPEAAQKPPRRESTRADARATREASQPAEASGGEVAGEASVTKAKTKEAPVNQRIVAFLDAHVGEAFSASHVAGALGRADKQRSIAAALSALALRGALKRYGTGLYTSRSTTDAALSITPPAPNTVVMDPQLLLDALVRGETEGTKEPAEERKEPAILTPPEPRPPRAPRAARKAKTVDVPPEEPPPPSRRMAQPPPLQADERTTQTASGAYVIRRRRATNAA